MKHLSIVIILLTGLLAACSKETAPQKCQDAFLGLLKSYNMTTNDLKDPEKVKTFKTRAKEEGKWAQFAQLCDNPKFQNCKSCTCDLDMSLSGCMWNCSCCWGDKYCSDL